MPVQQINRYLLQLVYLAVCRPCGPLERAVTQLCGRSFNIAVQVASSSDSNYSQAVHQQHSAALSQCSCLVIVLSFQLFASVYLGWVLIASVHQLGGGGMIGAQLQSAFDSMPNACTGCRSAEHTAAFPVVVPVVVVAPRSSAGGAPLLVIVLTALSTWFCNGCRCPGCCWHCCKTSHGTDTSTSLGRLARERC